MGELVELFVSCDLRGMSTHHDKIIARRGQRHCLVDSKRLVATKQLLDGHLAGKFASPLDGPVYLKVTYVYAFPASAPKRGPQRQLKTTRPDLSNLTKTVEDALTRAGAFHDDAQVAVKQEVKILSRTAPPGIVITVGPATMLPLLGETNE